MEITGIRIKRVTAEGPLKGYATVYFDNCFAVHGIKLISTGGKSFALFPAVKAADGSARNLCHPITAEFREYAEKELFEALEKAPYEDAEAPAAADGADGQGGED